MSDSPALLGGEPVVAEGPPAWPIPDPDVEAALWRAYQDGSWGQYYADHVEKLEAELAKQFHVEHVLTCGSGTFAVELALRSVKVGEGDEVILAAYDFPGNFLAVHALGAHPVLVDLHPDNWNLDPQCLESALSSKVKAILVSHLHGGLVPIREVLAFATSHNLSVVEDAAQAPGARVQGRPAGSWGDVGVLSFGGSKLLCGGRGGAVLTSRRDVYQRARRFQNRGNLVCPLTEMQAAMLLPQVENLDERTKHRSRVVTFLQANVETLPGVRLFQNQVEEATSAYYKVGWQFDPDAFGLSRSMLVRAMRAEGIALDEGFASLHNGRSPSRFRGVGPLTEADRAHAGTVILHHPILLGSEAEWTAVVEAWKKIHRHRDVLRGDS